MNILQAIYCNQYYELKPKGKEQSAKANGTGLATVTLVICFFGLLLLTFLIFPDLGEDFIDLAEDIFGRNRGRTIGYVVGLIPFLVIYPLVRITLGKEENYQALIERFTELPPDEQKRISDRGKYFFIISLLVVVVPVVVYAFSTLF